MNLSPRTISVTGLSMFFLSSVSMAQEAVGARAKVDGAILSRAAIELPEYEAAKGYTRRDGSQHPVSRNWSQREYEEARGDARFRLERLVYSSDGLRVVAYLYLPAEIEGAPLPAIIFNRGSGPQGEIAAVLMPFFRRLGLHGFVVIAPMLRGSAGGEGKDEMGGADVADLMNAFALARNLKSVDADKLFLYGESRGGMMTYQALRDGAPVRAAATFGGFTDLEAFFRQQPGMVQMARMMFPDFDAKRKEHLRRRSAVQWADKIQSPLLLMHGGDDRSINPSHALHLALALQAARKTYEIVVFAGDNHILSLNQVARDERAVKWFRRFMK